MKVNVNVEVQPVRDTAIVVVLVAAWVLSSTKRDRKNAS